MSIVVINHGSFKAGQTPDGIYIGRRHPAYPRASPLANPYRIGRAGATRADVIRWFKRELWHQLKKSGPMRDELLRLARVYLEYEELTLICFCVPLACHGEVIREAILWAIKEGLVRDETRKT